MALRARRRVNTGTTVEPIRLPAPIGGINAVDPGAELPARDCLYAYNVISTEQGVRARTGWREWATGLVGTFGNEVRTTIPFSGSAVANSRLFATTDKGIYTVSTSTSSPTLAYTFATTTPDAGWGVAQAVVTTSGHFLLYADEVNGLHYYSESTGQWAAYTTGSGTGQITGVDPEDIASVTVWKNRVWLTERNTAKAYYLDTGAIFGTATAFNFGQRFAHGGSLVGLYNWSTDGGSGLDTALVGISTGGDVVIYLGTDPASANTFGLKGVWFVGAVPAGRRIASDLGGDLLIISALGVVPLSRLILGDPDKLQYATAKIGPLFSRLANEAINVKGWAMHTHPTDNALMVLVPSSLRTDTTQLALSLGTRSWTQYRNIPIVSAAVWQGELFFGTSDGRVGRHVGHVDGVTLADPSSGDPVKWSLLMGYRGSHTQKQVQMVRPIVISEEGAPIVEATPRYDFNLTEPAEPSATASGPGSWNYGLIAGEFAQAELTGAGEIHVTQTDGTIPAEGTAVLYGATPESKTYTAYDSGTTVMDLEDPLDNDHAEDDLVLIVVSDEGAFDTAVWGGTTNPTVAVKGAVGMGRDIAIAVRGASYSRTTLVAVEMLYSEGGLL